MAQVALAAVLRYDVLVVHRFNHCVKAHDVGTVQAAHDFSFSVDQLRKVLYGPGLLLAETLNRHDLVVDGVDTLLDFAEVSGADHCVGVLLLNVDFLYICSATAFLVVVNIRQHDAISDLGHL